MKNNAKIIFFGTPEFAVPTLTALCQQGYNIVLVVTRADRPAGRKQKLSPTPVKIAAQALNLRIIDCLDQLKISEAEPDLGIVVAYGKLIPREILDIFPAGLLNLHPSALPKFRGPSPVQSAILSGEKETAATWIKLDQQMDHGPVVFAREVSIKEDDTSETLLLKLAESGADALLEFLPDYLSGKINLIPQAEKKATFSKILKKEDGGIDWRNKASEIERQIRAYYPWPGSYFFLKLKNQKKIRIKILEAEVGKNLQLPIGQPKFGQNQFFIQCGDQSLNIKKLQLEGKNPITAAEFSKGYKNQIAA